METLAATLDVQIEIGDLNDSHVTIGCPFIINY